MGVLSALPIISAGNFCCCLWVVSGGLFSAYLLQQNRSDAITAADGAFVGLLAGIVGAVIQFVLSIPIGLLVGPMERDILQRASEAWGSMAPASDEVFDTYRGGSGAGTFGLVILRLLVFFFTLTVGSVVSALSGVVGAAIFRRVSAPPALSGPPPTPPIS